MFRAYVFSFLNACLQEHVKTNDDNFDMNVIDDT